MDGLVCSQGRILVFGTSPTQPLRGWVAGVATCSSVPGQVANKADLIYFYGLIST